MASEFNYDADDTPDEVIRGVAAEMAGQPLAALSPEDGAARELEREVQRWEWQQRESEIAADHERERLAKAQAEQAEFLKEHREREALRREARQREIDRETIRLGLLNLQRSAARQDTFVRNVENAQRNALAYQQRQTILSNLEAMINPPEPPPERVVVVEKDEEDDTFCGVKVPRPNPRRSWW